MKRILWGLLILVSLVVSGCNAGGKVNAPADTGGTGTGGTGTGAGSTTAVAAALDLSASKLALLTNGTDSITFTVLAKNAQNGPAAGVNVAVASTGGFLSASKVTSDATGQATFTLGVANEKANRQISVTLTADAVIKTLPITISGTTLALSTTKLVTTPLDATPIELTATLRDAAAQPIADATIDISSLLGNTFTPSPGYVFTTGTTGTTDSAGLFKVKYNGSLTGDEIVTVATSGATTGANLKCNADSQAFFGFTIPADPSIPVTVAAPQPLTVAWINPDGTPKVGKTLIFNTNKGYFGVINTTMTTAITDAAGLATVQLNTGNITGPMTINVVDSGTTQTATLTLQVRATTPDSIDVQVTPGVIPVSTLTTASTATLKATVRDANNQAVAGMLVGFSILKGPGAGEFISPVTAITDNGGIATSTFTSGSMSSAQDGVEIQATVQGISPAKQKMTISQGAATITIGTTNKLGKIDETGYDQEFTVLVTDSSGGAVEGALVSLSLVPIRFYTGAPLVHSGVFLTEDANRNYILDGGEDCAQELDPLTLIATGRYWKNGSAGNLATIVNPPCTGNGRLDPGAVASVDSTVTTGANGMGVFNVYYPKSFGQWVDVEITATTDVTGTNASAKIDFFLNVIEGDTPYLPSPFGL
jgi:hypothetical protein